MSAIFSKERYNPGVVGGLAHRGPEMGGEGEKENASEDAAGRSESGGSGFVSRRPHSRLRSRNLTTQSTELFSSLGFLPHVPKVLWAAWLLHDTVRALHSP